MDQRNGLGGGVIDTIAHTMEENTSRRVFGEPFTKGDVTLIPAARVLGRGGGGGGGGHGTADDARIGEGSGGGLAQSARPVGAFVVRGSDVTWRPAVDLNRIVLGGQIVAVVALLVIRSVLNQRARRRHHHRGAAAARIFATARTMSAGRMRGKASRKRAAHLHH